MLEYDISGARFDYKKRYTGTRWQQGRVNIDQDNNADQEIKDHIRQRSFEDIIGSYGSPDEGFSIKNPRINENNLIDFDILSGHLYLGGLLLEIGTGKEPEGIAETFRLQQDWLNQLSDQDGVPILKEGEERCDLVYLEAWQQGVSPTEDSELLEPALGGPDTTTKVKNMRRIKIKTNIGSKECAKAWKKLMEEWENNQEKKIGENYEQLTNANLTITYLQEGANDDLCKPSISGEYLGAENQAIRVQLTGVNEAKFTWGFDNAAPLYRVEIGGNEVRMITSPKDQQHWPLAGNIVEILPWSAILPNGEKIAELRGHFSRVETSYDPGSGLLKLADVLPDDFGGDEWKERSDYEPGTEEYYYMRFWNRDADMNSGPEISFTPGNPVPLGNTGLAVTITGEKIDLQPNDYWIIAARPHSRNDGLPWDKKVLPWELEEGMAPFGICRFYAPLAIIHWTVENGNVVGKVIHDCRKKFNPLTEREGCCTYSVGDGVHSKGDYNSIEDAITHLPPRGGKICVLPGEHLANVVISGRQNIRISGCGEHTIIRPHPDDERIREPIFHIAGSQKIQLEEMTLVSVRGTAVAVEDTGKTEPASQDIAITNNWILACIHAITVYTKEDFGGANNIHITHNQVNMIDKEEGGVAIFCIADDICIEGNQVIVVPPPMPDDPNWPPIGPVPPVDIYDPCADLNTFYAIDFPLGSYVANFFRYAGSFKAFVNPHSYKTCGGIQVGATSERVWIKENEIIGGRCNGITLGHFEEEEGIIEFNPPGNNEFAGTTSPNITLAAVAPGPVNSFLYDIHIEANRIYNMGLSGIGVASVSYARNIFQIVSLENSLIRHNEITRCAQQTPEEAPEIDLGNDIVIQLGFGGISLALCENTIIQGNLIKDNGVSYLRPVCGIHIFYADDIDISNNHIENNGPRPRGLRNNSLIRTGERGGIVVNMAFHAEQIRIHNNQEQVLSDGKQAVKVHDNIVIQPLGHALLLFAFGPVSIVGNQLTSQGRKTSNQSPSSGYYSYTAGAVFIHNYGVSRDCLKLHSIPGYEFIANTPYDVSNCLEEVSGITAESYQYFPNGNVSFNNNQVTLGLRDSENGIGAIWIVTEDGIVFNSNQCNCTSSPVSPASVNFLIDYNTVLVGFSIISNGNRFQEGFTSVRSSLYSLAYMNTALGNQSTHCLEVSGAIRRPDPLSQSNIVLLPDRCKDY